MSKKFAAYKSKLWMWEIIDSIYKLFLTSIIAFVPFEYQLAIGLIGCHFYTALLLILSPYLSASNDVFHLFVQAEIFLLILAGYIFQKNYVGETYSDSDDIALSIALIGLSLLILALFLASAGILLYKTIAKKWKIYSDKKRKLNARKQLPPTFINRLLFGVENSNQTNNETPNNNNNDIFSSRPSSAKQNQILPA